ncbi:MAG: hypothetical protein ABIH03_01925 [Pseudomonadota bacterium]
MTAESDAARLLGSRGGSKRSPRKTDSARAANAVRWARTREAIEIVRQVGRQHGDLSLVADARLWRVRAWRKELIRRVGLHDAEAAERLACER